MSVVISGRKPFGQIAGTLLALLARRGLAALSVLRFW